MLSKKLCFVCFYLLSSLTFLLLLGFLPFSLVLFSFKLVLKSNLLYVRLSLLLGNLLLESLDLLTVSRLIR